MIGLEWYAPEISKYSNWIKALVNPKPKHVIPKTLLNKHGGKTSILAKRYNKTETL